MKISTLLLSLLLFSCSARNTTQVTASGSTADTQAPGDTVQALGKNIMRIYQDSKGNHWFASWEDGAYLHDSKTLLHFTTEDGLPSNRVEDIQEDRQGNIYLLTTKGITRYDGRQFVTLSETTGTESDWKLNPDDLWFKCTTDDGYAYRYDGKQLFKLKLPPNQPGEENRRLHPNYPNPYTIYCVYKDAQGHIWFGTAALGAGRYNGKTFDWILEEDVTELHNGPANGVRSIAEDTHGHIWFNTLYKYEMKESGNKFYTRIRNIGSLDGKPNSDQSEYLSSVRDNSGNLWFATYRAGAWKYDGQQVTHYPVQVNGQDITLFYIYTDNTGTLWLGTHENGAFRFNGETFEPFKSM